ncbi:MAG: cytochrome b [Burkholderiaceae bacterium]|jgi:cytochrome b|nr:cytochrome b [Burkholderiaceae bacterium]
MNPDKNEHKIRVWDLPTRCFHWVLAICILASFVSGKIGGDAMVWHGRFGVLALSLIVFRLGWGVVGPHYARFAQFIKGPRAVLQECRGQRVREPGHSPLGALSVLALLLTVAFQAGLGLFSSDDIAFDGPWSRHVSDDIVDLATRWHLRLQWLLAALIGLHIAAVLWHQRVRGHDLLMPMFTGDQQWGRDQAPSARDDWAIRARAVVLFALALLLLSYLSR